MTNIPIFRDSAMYTLDGTLKEVLLSCSKGVFPNQFRVLRGKIVTSRGASYDIPPDPMDLCNLVHDILSGMDKPVVATAPTPLSTASSRRFSPIADDAIYAYAKREASRLNKGDHHREQLVSCIFTALLLGDVSVEDFILEGDRIIHVNKIDTSVPCIERH